VTRCACSKQVAPLASTPVSHSFPRAVAAGPFESLARRARKRFSNTAMLRGNALLKPALAITLLLVVVGFVPLALKQEICLCLS
jgi:hypothetical protein